MGRRRATVCKRCGGVREAKEEALCNGCFSVVSSERKRKSLYGLSSSEFEFMRVAQSNSCAICRKHFDSVGGPKVDHSHATGDVRALLCNSCNLGLGHFGDNVVSLQSAISYLLSFTNQTSKSNTETEVVRSKRSDDRKRRKRK